MVRRLVDQQHIGRRRHGANQCNAAGFAARQVGWIGVPIDPTFAQQRAAAVGIVDRAKTCFDVGLHRLEAHEIGFLRKVGDASARMRETLALVRLDEAGRNFQQRRFAGTVASDKTDAVAAGDADLGAGQQRRTAEAQVDVL